jgi:hypothetical protein
MSRLTRPLAASTLAMNGVRQKRKRERGKGNRPMSFTECSGPVAADELGELSSNVYTQVEGWTSYLDSAMVALSAPSLPTSLRFLYYHTIMSSPDKILFPVHHSHHMLTTPVLPLVRTQRKYNVMPSRPSTHRVPIPQCDSVPHRSLRHHLRPPHHTFLLHAHPPRDRLRRLFAACADHCTRRNPSPPRPAVSGSGSSRAYRSKIPAAFEVT